MPKASPHTEGGLALSVRTLWARPSTVRQELAITRVTVGHSTLPPPMRTHLVVRATRPSPLTCSPHACEALGQPVHSVG